MQLPSSLFFQVVFISVRIIGSYRIISPYRAYSAAGLFTFNIWLSENSSNIHLKTQKLVLYVYLHNILFICWEKFEKVLFDLTQKKKKKKKQIKKLSN